MTTLHRTPVSILGIVTFGLGLLIAGPAAAAPAGARDHTEARADRMCAKLACTDAQKAKIQQIKATDKTPQQKAARDNLRKLQDQVQAELAKPSPDARAIASLDAQIAAQRTAVHSQRRARQLQILAVLSPEQRTKFLAHDKHGDGKRGDGKRGDGKHGKGQRGR